MLSRPLAFILLATACVAAAGGGAYIATRQVQRASAPAVTAAADPAPKPVGVEGGAATTNQPPQSPAEPAAPTASSAASPAVANPAPRAPAAPAKKAIRLNFPEQLVPATVARSVTPAQADGARTAPTLQPPASSIPPAETTTSASRPASGAPAPIVPMIVDPAAEAARAEQDAASRGPEKQWEEVLVPAESVIGLQLDSSISSEFARVEDRVDARVTRDVRVGSRVAIPAGTRAIGSIVLVERGGRVKERARLGLKFTTLILPDTTRLTINTETIYREGESPAGQSTAKIGGATIGGAILGAILGGGKGAAIGSGIGAAGGTAVAMNGDRMPVTLPAGTPLSVRTQASINMTVEK
jgi:type IV secretory pathway VirB10-like protein